jgi:glucosamine--fructose-6-phosphate aminotransferase (isomerizing)
MLGKFAEEGNTVSRLNCIERLVDKFTKESIGSTVGIAHTRWATCGEVSERNSHPHYDENKKIYIVHNGIINNHSEIKNKYLSDVTFRSETDT